MCVFHLSSAAKEPKQPPDMRPEMVNIIFGQLKKRVGKSNAVPPSPNHRKRMHGKR